MESILSGGELPSLEQYLVHLITSRYETWAREYWLEDLSLLKFVSFGPDLILGNTIEAIRLA